MTGRIKTGFYQQFFFQQFFRDDAHAGGTVSGQLNQLRSADRTKCVDQIQNQKFLVGMITVRQVVHFQTESNIEPEAAFGFHKDYNRYDCIMQMLQKEQCSIDKVQFQKNKVQERENNKNIKFDYETIQTDAIDNPMTKDYS